MILCDGPKHCWAARVSLVSTTSYNQFKVQLKACQDNSSSHRLSYAFIQRYLIRSFVSCPCVSIRRSCVCLGWNTLFNALLRPKMRHKRAQTHENTLFKVQPGVRMVRWRWQPITGWCHFSRTQLSIRLLQVHLLPAVVRSDILLSHRQGLSAQKTSVQDFHGRDQTGFPSGASTEDRMQVTWQRSRRIIKRSAVIYLTP